ncbi:hypothetical protein FIE12Z_5186 [Fusarium flagelliforme]|uniref:Uncharacterized protein n=1 Tax=Fusarium flagelliforme TaxID=2675880 RepID=A0A395MRZ8_9HYPO|nr:hypothetical protein FIE12Z_5186 [Fusarium flagelliforme]
MPDFRRLFTLLKVLTCDCFSPSDLDSPKKKPKNARPLLGEVNYVNYRSRPEHSYSTCGTPFVFLTFPDGFQCVIFEPGEPIPTEPRDVNGAKQPNEAKDKGKGKAND